ncbi:hypothetical protein B0H16DRAFT_1703360, partial [Mycena metata]
MVMSPEIAEGRLTVPLTAFLPSSMSIPCQILFKPRKSVGSLGTAWIPYGLEYTPIYLSHSEPPPEQKKEWDLLDFDCSIMLDRYLVEYHQEILPLPSLDDSHDICTLYVNTKSGALVESVERTVDFRLRTMKEMVGWWRRLPAAEANTVFPVEYGRKLDDKTLAESLKVVDIFSMCNNFLELKSWVCMFHAVDNWLVRCWGHYRRTVRQRHLEPHLICTAEYRLLYHDTNKLLRSLVVRIQGARDKPSPD